MCFALIKCTNLFSNYILNSEFTLNNFKIESLNEKFTSKKRLNKLNYLSTRIKLKGL